MVWHCDANLSLSSTGMVLIMTLFVIILLPETKNKDLENTFRLFQLHWFWSRTTSVKAVHSLDLPTSAYSKTAPSDDSDSDCPKGAAHASIMQD